MLYTVIDVSKRLSISRQAVYKKLEKMATLKPHIKVKNNVKYIDEDGLELIKMSIEDNSINTEVTTESTFTTSDYCNEGFSSKLSDLQDTLIHGYIKSFEEDKRKLFEEIQTKNKQIEALNDALNQSQKLNENNQILLRQEQERNKLLLETSQTTQETSRGSNHKPSFF